MQKFGYDGIVVKVIGLPISEEEAIAYAQRGKELHGDKVSEIHVTVDPNDPEMVDIEYMWGGAPFNRLRRITGYLVGTLSRWNNGKRAEERDRVKHG